MTQDQWRNSALMAALYMLDSLVKVSISKEQSDIHLTLLKNLRESGIEQGWLGRPNA